MVIIPVYSLSLEGQAHGGLNSDIDRVVLHVGWPHSQERSFINSTPGTFKRFSVCAKLECYFFFNFSIYIYIYSLFY